MIRRRFVLLAVIAAVTWSVAIATAAQEKAAVQVKGRLSEVNGVRVLTVWGTPREQGFAHGYLFSDEAQRIYPQLLGLMSLAGPMYETVCLPKIKKMTIDARTEEELRGILEGIEAKAGGKVQIAALGRSIQYDDLVMINCMETVVRTGCSSFAAWGSMTEGGGTIVGRNMDWPEIGPLVGTQILLVRRPAPGSDALPYVAVTWPTFIGPITGINSEGVMVAMHDADGHKSSIDTGFTPSGIIYRRALESTHAKTAPQDALRVMQQYTSSVGSNMVITLPSIDGKACAFVCEHDGDKNDGQGVTLREPDAGATYFICTNHFRKRSPPTDCWRYAKLQARLDEIAKSGGKITVDDAWKMMESVCQKTNLAHHTVIFEPNKRLLHIAFAEPGKSAPLCKHVTLKLDDLLTMPKDAR